MLLVKSADTANIHNARTSTLFIISIGQGPSYILPCRTPRCLIEYGINNPRQAVAFEAYPFFFTTSTH
jgi:hypothetical protein